MIDTYINSAIKQAKYEFLPEDNSIYGEIPSCQGVYAKANILEECREELISTLEDWIMFRLNRNLEINNV